MQQIKFGDINYSKNISWCLLDNEIFIFDEMTGKIYLLKDLSKDFWLLIQNEKKLINIMDHFSNGNNKIENNIIEIATNFLDKKLVVWSNNDETRTFV